MSNLISVTVQSKSVRSMSPHAFVSLFTENGWSITSDDGLTTYLPLAGDENDEDYDEADEFTYQSRQITEDELWKILAQKSKNDEMMGVMLHWKDNGPKLDLTFDRSENCCGFPELDVTIRLDENLKSITPETPIPDYSWYVRNVLLCLWKEYHIPRWTIGLEL